MVENIGFGGRTLVKPALSGKSAFPKAASMQISLSWVGHSIASGVVVAT